MSCQDLKSKVLCALEDPKHAFFSIGMVGLDFAYSTCYSHSEDQKGPNFACFTAKKPRVKKARCARTGVKNWYLLRLKFAYLCSKLGIRPRPSPVINSPEIDCLSFQHFDYF